MPLPTNHPIVLHGAPLTPPPPTGPHKPNLAIQARLAPELIAAIVDARKKGLALQFEAYGPGAGFHIDGKHFPIHSVVAERTPHEVYAYRAAPQPELQVIGKVAGRCGVQRTLTEGDQEKLLQSRSAAENASTRTIGRLDAPGVPAKGAPAKRKPAVKKSVIDANTAAALRASPAPGTAGNSPPPTARPATLDGPPNAFQTLLIHHLAYAPSTIQRLATAVKRQVKEIRPCLDSIATNDESPTGPRPDSPTWTLKPTAYQYLRLAAPNGSASGGPWIALTSEDTKRMIADATRAFDQLKLPPDAPPRLALAAQQPAPPLPPTPAPSAKSQESTPASTAAPLKHPLPARPTTASAPNGRLDAPKTSRVASPAVPASDVAPSPRDTPAAPPPRAPVRPSAVKDKSKTTEGDAEPTPAKKNGASAKSKAGANGKEKTKVKSKAIITADSDGEDFVATKRDRERKPPPPAPTPAPPRVATVAPTLHSRAPSTSSTRTTTETSTKKVKRDADIAALLEHEVDMHDSGSVESSSRPTTATATAPAKAATSEGKKRRVKEEDQPRVRTKEVVKERVKEGKEGKVARDPERKVKTVSSEVKRKRDMDQESDASYDTRHVEKKKKKRRADAAGVAVAASSPAPLKREPQVREREVDTTTEARPKKPLPTRDSDSTPRAKEKVRKAATGKTNGASASASTSASTSAKTNGLGKKKHESAMYTTSEDEAPSPAPTQRRPPTTSASAAPSARPPKAAAPSPSEASTPRDRERDRRRPAASGGDRVVLPPKRPPLPPNASVEDVRERYAEVYADYMGLNARLSTERVKVQRLLKDMDDGDHDAILDTSVVESLTKAYREAHEELVALKERVGAAA